MAETTTVETPRCMHCGKTGTVTVPVEGYRKWQNREAPIQQALNTISVDDREQLISGTHPACWDAMFGSEP